MAESSTNYHEPYELLPEGLKDMHRAIVSIQEELEAVDWYAQRAAVCADGELKDILLHNRDEEVEHAFMLIEWLRRKDPVFAQMASTYIASEGPILSVEEKAMGKAAPGGDGGGGRTAALEGPGGIGSLKATS
jgi:ferritin-like protein